MVDHMSFNPLQRYTEVTTSLITFKNNIQLDGYLTFTSNGIDIRHNDGLAINIGVNNTTNTDSISIGNNADSVGNSAVAIGVLSESLGVMGIAIGGAAGVEADAGSGVAIGTNTISGASNALAMMSLAQAHGVDSIAIGEAAYAGGEYGVAIGKQANANIAGQITLGSGYMSRVTIPTPMILEVNDIVEDSNNAGVTIDGVLLKDDGITVDADIITTTDSQNDVGKTGARFANGWFDNINGLAINEGTFNYRQTLWAERGTVTSNQYMALGNGQTPRGVPMGQAGYIVSFSATTTAAVGTSLSGTVYKNGVTTGITMSFTNSLNVVDNINSDDEDFVKVAFSKDDVLGIFLGTEVGTWTEVVCSIDVEFTAGITGGLKGETGATGATGAGNVDSTGTPVVNNSVVRYDGTDGNSIQESGVIIDDSDNITGVTKITAKEFYLDNTGIARLYYNGSTKNILDSNKPFYLITNSNNIIFNSGSGSIYLTASSDVVLGDGNGSTYMNGFENYVNTDLEVTGTLTTDVLTFSSTDHPQLTGHEVITRARAKELAEANTPYDNSVVEWVERDENGIHFMAVDMQTGDLYELQKTKVGTVDWTANASYEEKYRWDSSSGTVLQRRIHKSKFSLPEGKMVDRDTGKLIDKK